MKRRTIKKIATMFLAGKKSYPMHQEECVTHNDGRPGIDQW